VDLEFLFFHYVDLRQACQVNHFFEQGRIQLELLVHLSDDGLQVVVDLPVLKLLVSVQVVTVLRDFRVDHPVQHVDRGRRRREEIGHRHLDEEGLLALRHQQGHAEVFAHLRAFNYDGVREKRE